MKTLPNLVLIGGGHSHAIALKLWGNQPLLDVKVTLISDVEQTPYSGMLPGHVAGFYSYDETHINLRNLCQFAGVELIIDKAIGLNLDCNQVICQNHFPIDFDYLSIDIGSTPEMVNIPGAEEYAIAAKPVPLFLNAWENLLQTVKSQANFPLKIVIVGGGAGGVELALNMQSRLLQEVAKNQIEISIIHRGTKLVSSHNSWVSNRLEKILLNRGIKLFFETEVIAVQENQIVCSKNIKIDCNYIFWVTQASVPDWIKNSQLTTDEKGFILVSNTLQSVSHNHVFVAGDIATIRNYSRPKAGVFAVRQGKPLFNNWQRLITGKKLHYYVPQKRYLALIGTGNKSAIAFWGFWGYQSSLLWKLKDYIDRKFMTSFDVKI